MASINYIDTVAKALVLMDQERLYDGLVDPEGALVALDLNGFLWDRPKQQSAEDRLLTLLLKREEPQDRLRHTIFLQLPLEILSQLQGLEGADSQIVQDWLDEERIDLNQLPRLIN